MMQEEIDQKSTALIIKGTKLTAKMLAKAMAAALRQMKKSRDKPGKQSFKQLSKGGNLENIPISEDNINCHIVPQSYLSSWKSPVHKKSMYVFQKEKSTANSA